MAYKGEPTAETVKVGDLLSSHRKDGGTFVVARVVPGRAWVGLYDAHGVLHRRLPLNANRERLGP